MDFERLRQPQACKRIKNGATILLHPDIVALILLGGALILGAALARQLQQKRAQVRMAYLGYAVCALVVGLFQLHLATDGPAIFMMFGLFLLPIVFAGALAFGMTVSVRSNKTLLIRGTATLALGFFQILTMADILGALMNVIARGYVILVFAACVYRRLDWWPAKK